MPWFMDRDLARRLERTEGAVSASYTAVPSAAERSGATWHDFDGTYAMFDGPESPLSQTFGLGLFAPATAALLSRIEAFFAQRGACTMHEVSPLAGIETFALLAERGYRPVELSTVLVQPIDDAIPPPPTVPALEVRACAPDDAWIAAWIAGWAGDPAVAAALPSLAEVVRGNRDLVHFAVERDQAAIATASLGVHGGVALLAGASTIPPARGLGAQSLLLAARLAEARHRGCELAMMVAMPGSASQRNAERRGFRVAYTRTKWRLDRRA